MGRSPNRFDSSILWSAAIGFALRVGIRLYTGKADFFANGYTFFFDLSRNIASGNGIALTGQPPTAFRVPLYPVFLAVLAQGRPWFLPIVLAQAAVGAGTILIAATLAEELWPEFSPGAAGIIAAVIAAFYPYYLVHDTALQETSLLTFLTGIGVLFLLRARNNSSRAAAAGAGFALGMDVLTRASIASFAILAPLLLIWPAAAALQRRVQQSLLCALGIVLVVAPWLWRSYRLGGTPSLSTETGLELWNGNNALTFSHYPRESIDLSQAAAYDAFTSEEKSQLEHLAGNEEATNAWYREKGEEYILSHPAMTLANSLRKLGAAFGWLPSPRRDTVHDLVYALSYGPVMLLGLWGMWTRRAHWREDALIYALFISFAGVTAVFFGHSSHRSFLDVYWIAFASGPLSVLRKNVSGQAMRRSG